MTKEPLALHHSPQLCQIEKELIAIKHRLDLLEKKRRGK